MKIIEKLASKKPSFSFEFFPPKDEEGKDRLFETIAHLQPYEPTFVSVTYGAGGSTRKLTVDLTVRIKREPGIESDGPPHLRGRRRGTRSRRSSTSCARAGSRTSWPCAAIPRRAQRDFVAAPGGFAHAVGARRVHSRAHGRAFASAAPATRRNTPKPRPAETDLANLKKKVDAGAELLVTQLFFDSKDYFSFVERARAIGITVPILPGIMPITNVGQIKRFTAICGAHIPEALLERLEADP